MRCRTGVLAAVACVWLCGMALAGTPEEEARRYLVRGATALEMAQGNDGLADAVAEFKKASEIAPAMPAPWFNMGLVHARMGDFAQAIECYRRYVELAPDAEDAAKVRDEIVRLEYRQEQAEKFKGLSGQWVTEGGNYAVVAAQPGSITVFFPNFTFKGLYDYSLDDQRHDATPMYTNLRFNLKQNGANYVGVLEDSGFKPGFTCQAPPQRSDVVGTLENGRIVLRWTMTSFRVEEKFGSLFDTTVYCAGVSAQGPLHMEASLQRLPPGAVARDSPGLRPGDRIVAVNGVELETLQGAERMLKLRGQPGDTVQLVVERMVEEGGTFKDPKYERLPVTVTLQEAQIDPAAVNSDTVYSQGFFIY